MAKWFLRLVNGRQIIRTGSLHPIKLAKNRQHTWTYRDRMVPGKEADFRRMGEPLYKVRPGRMKYPDRLVRVSRRNERDESGISN